MALNKSKSKALKSTENKSGFVRALIVGMLVCFSVWIVLALVVSLIVSGQKDSTALIGVVAPAVTVVSLVAGGFAVGFKDKVSSGLSSFLLGCLVLGISYALSAAFDLSHGLGAVSKTLKIVIMLVCPLIGARISCRKKGKQRRHKR